MRVFELRRKGVTTMKTARSRLASAIAVASLIVGAAACAATDDNDTGSTPSSVNDTASKPSSEDPADVAAAQSIDDVDLNEPPPDDLSLEDEKAEKNYDCCVFKNNVGEACGCITVTGRPASTWFQCQFMGAAKRGSGCGAYTDCQGIIGDYCGFGGGIF
jgi:hypothetical protein